MTADVHVLTGAYVVDAVSAEERLEFEGHLRECPTCSLEVHELRETTTRLGRAAAAVPPEWLKDAVRVRIRQVRQDPATAPVTPLARRRPSWPLRLTSAAAAVLLVAAGVLGMLVVQAQQTTEDAQARATAMSTILTAGDAQVLTQDGRDGGRLTMIASRAADQALLLPDDLPELGPDQVYQAWTIGDRIESAGLLPDGTTPFEVDDLTTADTIGITVEPAGGSTRPTLPNLILDLDLP
ncbi:anti-sigma factor [Actinophytocola sediminis]